MVNEAASILRDTSIEQGSLRGIKIDEHILVKREGSSAPLTLWVSLHNN